MKIPEKVKWRKKWGERDVRKISEIADGLRQRGAPSDASAIVAAEEEYMRSGQVRRR